MFVSDSHSHSLFVWIASFGIVQNCSPANSLLQRDLKLSWSFWCTAMRIFNILQLTLRFGVLRMHILKGPFIIELWQHWIFIEELNFWNLRSHSNFFISLFLSWTINEICNQWNNSFHWQNRLWTDAASCLEILTPYLPTFVQLLHSSKNRAVIVSFLFAVYIYWEVTKKRFSYLEDGFLLICLRTVCKTLFKIRGSDINWER
jgi:hypothetical protein